MRARFQSTLRRSVGASGVGLHSGAPARVTIAPAEADTGVVFIRTDVDALIRAAPAAVTATRLGVSLADERGVAIMTVEHLLAALSLCGVDNARVLVEGPELPILDGSAAPFVALIAEAELALQGAPRRFLRIDRPLRLEDGARFIEAHPADGFEIDVSIDFPDAGIGRQRAVLKLDPGAPDVARLSRARTFCALKDVEAMRAGGLARGGSLGNAVVVDGARLLNPEGLRDPDEFALHKALDLVGDLSLAGAPVLGRIRAHRPGHDLNTRFVTALCAAAAGTGLSKAGSGEEAGACAPV